MPPVPGIPPIATEAPVPAEPASIPPVDDDPSPDSDPQAKPPAASTRDPTACHLYRILGLDWLGLASEPNREPVGRIRLVFRYRAYVDVKVMSSKGMLFVDTSQNVIIRNLNITGGEDAIAVKYTDHLWIDHLDVSSCSDGLIDITRESDMYTVSWTRFSDHQ